MAAKERNPCRVLRSGTFPDFDRALPGADGLDAIDRIAQAPIVETAADDRERPLDARKDLTAHSEDNALSRHQQALRRYRNELARLH